MLDCVDICCGIVDNNIIFSGRVWFWSYALQKSEAVLARNEEQRVCCGNDCIVCCDRSSFSDFASKYGKDERFKGIEKMKDRESLFRDFTDELRSKEKMDSRSQKEKVSCRISITAYVNVDLLFCLIGQNVYAIDYKTHCAVY